MGNSKRSAFQFIIDKVLSRIEGWRAKSLSQVGRLVLLKSVAASIPSYGMSSFLIPMSLCSSLDRSFKNFWWGFPPSNSRKLTLKAWDSICLPKDLGGLGIRKMREVNLALLAKLGWKLLCNTDSMWVAQLRGKYLSSNSLLSLIPILTPLGYGKVSTRPLLSFLKVPVLKSIANQPFPSGIPRGFPPSPLSLHLLLLFWLSPIPSFL
jgi:hypothetical protein